MTDSTIFRSNRRQCTTCGPFCLPRGAVCYTPRWYTWIICTVDYQVLPRRTSWAISCFAWTTLCPLLRSINDLRIEARPCRSGKACACETRRSILATTCGGCRFLEVANVAHFVGVTAPVAIILIQRYMYQTAGSINDLGRRYATSSRKGWNCVGKGWIRAALRGPASCQESTFGSHATALSSLNCTARMVQSIPATRNSKDPHLERCRCSRLIVIVFSLFQCFIIV